MDLRMGKQSYLPGLVEGVPVHTRGVGTKRYLRSLSTQTYDSKI